MQFQFSEEHEAFRQEVRDFIRDNLPEEMARRQRQIPFPPVDADCLAWSRILHDKKGWSVPMWPVEYGGQGWDALRLFIFEEEMANADAPPWPMFNTHMNGPVIYTFGSDEIKERFLPPMQRGDYIWAQGFSEPGSGSDLASLRTTAVREGDHYIVNGQKIWTSGAMHAEWGFFLVKTDTTCKPQKGISYLLINMSTPGVTVRPIQQISGEPHVCEVFLEDVRVPVENLVGEEGAGWTYGKFLLNHERTGSAFIFWNKREIKRIHELARKHKVNGVPVIDQPEFRNRLAKVEAQVLALEWSVLRVLANEKVPYHETAVASCLKVRGSQLQQSVTELQMQALGLHGLRYTAREECDNFTANDPAWPDYVAGRNNTALIMRASTIFGGTLQVQRGLIAKLAFGL